MTREEILSIEEYCTDEPPELAQIRWFVKIPWAQKSEKGPCTVELATIEYLFMSSEAGEDQTSA